VILPDDVIAAETPCLQQMVEAYNELGGNMVAAMEVPDDQTKRLRHPRREGRHGIRRVVKGMVEKPPAGRRRPTSP
jgi:UTP--glucose-1-phosphate uridylyltransferase